LPAPVARKISCVRTRTPITVVLAAGLLAGAVVAAPGSPVLAAPRAATAAPAAAGRQNLCLGSYTLPHPRPAATLRFGVDPDLAGSPGPSQASPAPKVRLGPEVAALRRLRAPGRVLVVRLSRLFWSQGRAGLRRLQPFVRRLTGGGFRVELQVRYHPPAGKAGDIAAWDRYVREVVRTFGPDPRVVAMTITNEDNVTFSPNTSDGYYRGAREALVSGVETAHALARRLGFRQLRFGFTYAWRFDPRTDAALFRYLRVHGGPAFRRALGFVGVDLYPGSVYPPASAGASGLGADVRQALATVRRCYLAIAGIGRSTPIWVTENGYPTTPGVHSPDQQRAALLAMVHAVLGCAGSYHVTDYRWFNLRDNNSRSPGIFDTDGLLSSGYARKPAFWAYARLIAQHGSR
jgi:hypothetical protein